MGMIAGTRPVGARLAERVAAERAFVAEDVAGARASARRAGTRAVEALTPARRSGVAITLGVALTVLGLALWSITVALIAAGAALVVYGAVLVDLDVSPPRRRRKKRVSG